MAKYRAGEEDELERFSRWLRGIYLRPPTPNALELKLNRGEDGETMLVRLEKEDLSSGGTPDAIAEHLYSEAKGESERLTGTNRFVVYLYREGYKEGRRPHGHHLFRIESPEDESVDAEIGRTEPVNEKGYSQALMRFSLEERRTMAGERTQMFRHYDSLFSQMSNAMTKFGEQQLQLLEVINLAQDRTAERQIMVDREKRKDRMIEQAGSVFGVKILPALADSIMSKLLPAKAANGANGAANGSANGSANGAANGHVNGGAAPSPAVSLATEICGQTIEVVTLLDQDAEMLAKFKALISETQLNLLRGIIGDLKARTDVSKDDAVAVKVNEFIGSFTEEQATGLASIVTPTLGALFLKLHDNLKQFAKSRESATSANTATANK